MTDVPIRAWLEPAYDHGRYGAWMLDWPGCFVWRDDRAAVLAAVPAAVAGHAGWLRRHGEAVADPSGGTIDVVEEVPATVVDDYERNATFDADHRPVSPDEVATTVRRLGFARTDLLAVVDRLERFERERRRLGSEPDGDRRSRSARGVLRHLGGAEIWLAGRLDGSLRYAGPDIDAGPRAYLASTRAWAVETLGDLASRSPQPERTDGKGETWTLPKVLRRLVYHSLDHLAELERRLAAAEAEGG